MSTVRIWTIALAVAVALCNITLAAEKKGGGDNTKDVAIEKKFSKPTDDSGRRNDDTGKRSQMGDPQDAARQGLLAQLLVLQTGLYRYLPPNPTDAQCFEALAQNDISPEAGWQADKIVTRGDLARVIVQGLGMQDQVENQGDPKAWVDTLASVGITITTIGEAVKNVNPITTGKRANPFFGEDDEMSKDEQALANEDIAYVLRDVFPAVPREPVTPN